MSIGIPANQYPANGADATYIQPVDSAASSSATAVPSPQASSGRPIHVPVPPKGSSTPLSAEAWWERLNERRLRLIDKDIDQGLSAAERAELDGLEQKAEEYVNARFPVDFSVIEKLKRCAERDGFTVKAD